MALRIQEHVSLKELTTMKIGGSARYFCIAATREEAAKAALFAKEKGIPVAILGSGSNILIANGEINALVLKIEIRGIEWIEEKEGSPTVLVVVGAGENWDNLIAQAVEKGFWGIENLSGIPGTVGAAPIQNIGAYGTEVKETIAWVDIFDTNTGTFRKLTNEKCQFAYRDSVFKKSEGKSFIVLSVAFLLRKDGIPNVEYKDLREKFNYQLSIIKKEKKGPTLQEIREAVLEIRSRKFPDLTTCGTAGSFFKNPIVSKNQFDELKEKFPDLPGFPSGSGVKVSLAWVLDNICNLKGYERGNVKLFEKQPIVLVQNGKATSEEVETFAKEIVEKVKKKTGIAVEWEVQGIR